MSAAECTLWALLGCLFWRKKLQRRFPSMGSYVTLHVLSAPVLLALLVGQSLHWFNDSCYALYFFAYWAIYIASTAMLYFVCMEVFRAALSGFPGLARFGVVIFRWAALASLASFSAVSISHSGVKLWFDLAYGLMRAAGVIELCLLGFLFLSRKALRLSQRDLAFGIALGFGLMGANDFIESLAMSIWTPTSTAPWQFVYPSLTLLALGIWTVYFAIPEPTRKTVMVPANSTVYRWNEIASALGHTGTQVAVQPHADGFFLSDVERVVDKVLNRTLKSKESES